MKHCFHPECNKAVDNDMFGCKKHWLGLPKVIRDKIWDKYLAWSNGSGTIKELRSAQQVAFDFVARQQAENRLESFLKGMNEW